MSNEEILQILYDAQDANYEYVSVLGNTTCQDYNNVLVRTPNGLKKLIEYFGGNPDANKRKKAN